MGRGQGEKWRAYPLSRVPHPPGIADGASCRTTSLSLRRSGTHKESGGPGHLACRGKSSRTLISARSACSSTAARAASGCCTPRAAVAMPLTRTARRLGAGCCGVARADTASIRLKSSTTLEQDIIAERLLAPGAGRLQLALFYFRGRVGFGIVK